jgi:small-conductance mechanosensitive channel
MVKTVRWGSVWAAVISLLIVGVVYVLLPTLFPYVSDTFADYSSKIGRAVIFLLGGWVLSSIVNVLINREIARHETEKANNLKERSVKTRMKYVKLIANIVIFLVAIGFAARQFDTMRELSTGILASAGVAGIIIAFSAQTFLANLLAGFEIAFTQPIRIDDVVIVEGEWGRIENIKATHVIVKIWDQRRLVVPITYFVKNPFQNWTKTSSEIWGTATFYVDYTMPVEVMRKQLTKILKETPKWDGQINSLQVVDTTEKTIAVRALMSAKNSGDAWDLRCFVREEMIAFLQKNHPEKLPQFRLMQQ